MSSLSYTDRIFLLSSFHDLDKKGIYGGKAFWIKLCSITKYIGLPGRCRELVDEVYDMGGDFMTTSERYYDLHGETYDEYCVPSFEEDKFEEDLYNESINN
jgi:hypothetical protein